MHIAVCVKPVPDPKSYDKITINPETKLLERNKIPMVINPTDKHAIEAAIQLKELYGGKVILISMAPPGAKEVLKDGLAMGVDEAYLLSDRFFAGADTFVTAKTLATGLKKIENFDLVFAGSESADGGTSHVPSQLGEMLGIPHLNHVLALVIEEGILKIKTKIENGYMDYEGRLPMVLGVAREINTPRYIPLMGVIQAQGKPFTVWGSNDLQLDPAVVGLAGSPTQPGSLHTPPLGRKVEMLDGEIEEVAEKIIVVLHSAGMLS